MSKITIALSPTSLDSFQDCACKFNLRHNLKKVLPEKDENLSRGEVLHKGFEVYYSELKKNTPFEKALDLALVAERVVLSSSNLDTVTGNRILDVTEENLNYWRVIDQSYVINQIEAPFAYVLYEDDKFRFILTGKVDLLISDNRYTNLPVDHKSFKRDFGVNRRTNQFITYSEVTGSNYLLVNRVGFQTTKSIDEKYRRVPLSYDPIYREQWKVNTIKWFFKYYDACVENSWEMNNTSCNKYNKLCEYDDICDTSGDENKLYKLEANFKDAGNYSGASSALLDVKS